MPIGTLWASRPPWDRKIGFLVYMLFSIAMLALTACGQNSTPATSANPLSDPRSMATPASADGRFSVDAPPSLRGESAKPTSPFADVKPLEIKQGGSLGALGLNMDTYFAGNINDTSARIDRLEGAVTAMHRDLKILAPSLQRLALIETDLQDLVGQLEAMLQEEGGAAPVPTYTPPTPLPAAAPQSSNVDEPMDDMAEAEATSAPTPVTAPAPSPAPAAASPAPQPPPPQATPPPVAAGALQISALRFGGDGGKTRIVFDANQSVTYTKDLDNGENLLVIEIPNAGWGAAAQGTAPKSSAVNTWAAQSNGSGGTRVVMTLKKSVSVTYEGVMKPEKSNPHFRIVIDLMPN